VIFAGDLLGVHFLKFIVCSHTFVFTYICRDPRMELMVLMRLDFVQNRIDLQETLRGAH